MGIQINFGLILSAAIPLTVAASVELCGRKKEIGFALGLLAQTCNGTYGLVTGDWGWVFAWVVTGPIFLRWYLKWRKAQRVVDGTSQKEIVLRIPITEAPPAISGSSSNAPNV